MSLPEPLHPSISYSSWFSERRCFHCRPLPARRTNVHITVPVETTRRSVFLLADTNVHYHLAAISR